MSEFNININTGYDEFTLLASNYGNKLTKDLKISKLKMLIGFERDIDWHNIILKYNGTVMDNEKILNYYGINSESKKDAIIEMVALVQSPKMGNQRKVNDKASVYILTPKQQNAFMKFNTVLKSHEELIQKVYSFINDKNCLKNELLSQLNNQYNLLIKILVERRIEIEKEIEALSSKQNDDVTMNKIEGYHKKLKTEFNTLQEIKGQLIDTVKKNKFCDMINMDDVDIDRKDDVKYGETECNDITDIVDDALNKLDTQLKGKIKILIGDEYKIVDSVTSFSQTMKRVMILHKRDSMRPSDVELDESNPYKRKVTQLASCLAKDGVSIIIAGGHISDEAEINKTYKYDPIKKVYNKLANIPNKVRGFEMIRTPDNKIVAVGGYPHGSKYYIYDEDDNKWETLSLPYNAYWEPQIVFDNEGNLHVAGGRDHYMCIWNNKRWLKLKDLPFKINQGGFCKGPDDELYLFGGTSGADIGITNSMWMYNTETKEWKQGPSMPKKRTQFGYVSTNSEIIVCGGGLLYGGCDKSEFNDIFMFDFNEQKWIISDQKLLKPVREFTMTINKNGEIHAFGGARNGSRINDHFIVK